MGDVKGSIPDLSIVMLAKNERVNLEKSLDVVLSQIIDKSFEVIIIDSGSTDGSVELVESKMASCRNLHLYQISPEEFHHARTRNFGAGLAKAPIICFLGGDAVPEGFGWLEALSRPLFENFDVHAVYGRQIPREYVDFVNRVRLTFVYPETGMIKCKGKTEDPNDLYFFSSVNCAINRAGMKEPLFDEVLPVGEDLSLSVKIINSGKSIVYEPVASVIHSHNYSSLDIMRRYYDTAIVCRYTGIHDGSSQRLSKKGIRFLAHAFNLLKGRGLAEWFCFGGFLCCAFIGTKLGKRSELLPGFLARQLSVYDTSFVTQARINLRK